MTQAQTPPAPRVLVLFNPAGAFVSTTLRPLWGLGVIVMLAFAALPAVVFVARVDESVFVERQMKRSGALEKMPAEQRASAVDISAKLMKVALPGGAMLKRSIWMTLLTLVCLALLKASKPETRMAPLAGAVALAMAPLALLDVISAVTFLVKDPLRLDAGNPVLSNPAAWFHLDENSVAAAVARGADFFELWACALVGYGVRIAGATRSALPYAVAFGGHALVVGGNALLAALA